MFIPYTERDTQLNPTGTNWLQDRIVAFQRQRSPLSYAVRQAVVKFNDQMTDADKKTVVKHFIPWIRIFRQLAANIVTHGDQNGRGMTRAQSIEYLNWVLNTLKVDQVQLKRPDVNPEHDRHSYDVWISWAVDTICDWPENLFQGQSAGDGGGNKVDVPKTLYTTPALQQRVEEARVNLKNAIRGLDVGHEIGDALPVMYEEYIPGEDEWFLPYA
ncbi:hypothetical protein GGU11DRAFT_858323 [Lentinula aff. detonsa]|nr:hypothetical protein GGU11DRAFT_858323 [Lentinula aff. detonsa]